MFIVIVILFIISVIFYIISRTRVQPLKVVEFAPPQNMTPIEMQYFHSGYIDDRGFIAMFVYFENQGYLKKEKLQNGSVVLTKIKDIDSSEDEYSQFLFNKLFENSNECYINQTDFEKIGKELEAKLNKKYSGDKAVITDTLTMVSSIIGFILILTGIYMLYKGTRSSLHSSEAKAIVMIIGLIPTYMLIKVSGRKALKVGSQTLALNYDDQDIATTTKGKVKAFILMLLAAGLSGAIAYACQAMASHDATSLNLIISVIEYILIYVSALLFIVIKFRNPALQKLEREMLGFEQFIKVSEVPRIDVLAQSDVKYYNKVLPYAYVFNLTNRGLEDFGDVNVFSQSLLNN